MQIITDLRKIKGLIKKYNLNIDKDYKYINNNPYSYPSYMEYKGKRYKAQYFSGCLCPYIVEITEAGQ